MKNLVKISIGMLLCTFLLSNNLFSQDESEEKKPTVLVVTTVHWNTDKEDGTPDKWLAIEKEYHEKVTMKNDLVMGANFMTHYFTADNSEAKVIAVYGSWEDVELAADKNNELAKAAWPDEAERDAFFKERNSYYSSMHSDEIYSILDGGKYMDEIPTEPMVYYVRVSHLAFPDDGKNEEIKALNDEFLENVVYKNEYVKGYYPHRHLYGSDSRQIIEAFAVNSLADVAASLEKNVELINAHWPDEAARKEFFKKYNRYFSGWHGDYIYQNVPELAK